MLVSSRHLRVVVSRSSVSDCCIRCLHLSSRPRPRLRHAPTRQVWRVPNKGKTTSASLNPKDLPQTPAPLEPLKENEEKPKKKRGRKSQASLNLEDPPQSSSPLAPLKLELESPSYPTVIQQARNNMHKFENCVLLTRVGGFYEMYFEHAQQYGPQLNLKVADKPISGDRFVPMVYFPLQTILPC